MTNLDKMFKSNFFARYRDFQYLEDKDKYLFALDEPKYKFNIIGAGMMGQEHLRITALEGRAMVHGIYDTSPFVMKKARRMNMMYSPKTKTVKYDSLEKACQDPEVDGLIISTPNFTHIDVVREAVKSGKHILLEKPMATTVEDAYEISQLAKNYTAVFQMGLQYRYKAIYVEAIHEILERNVVGNVKMVNILEHRVPFLDKVDQWNKFSKFSGGTLVEKCCHYFDLLNLFSQSTPISVYANGSMAVNFVNFEYNNERSDIIDNAYVIVEYSNGIRANFSLCMFSPMFYEELYVCGDEGRLLAHEYEDFLPTTRPKTHLEIARGEYKPSRVTNPMYPSYIEEMGHNGATFFEHIYFVDNIEGKETTTATAEEGLWSVVVGVAAQESIKQRNVVNIDNFLREKGISL